MPDLVGIDELGGVEFGIIAILADDAAGLLARGALLIACRLRVLQA